VGAIEASSAIDSITKNMPQVTTSVSQMAPAVPPLASEKMLVVRENSHVNPRTMTYPTMEKNLNRRCAVSASAVSVLLPAYGLP
jgi:K+/H+ antiporter YhaU regulatory subunit KhtT